MKAIRILFFIGVIVPGSYSVAQNFSFKGGLNLSNMHVSDNDGIYSDNYKMKPGFHVGANIDLPIGEIFSVETGMIFGTKGYNYKETVSSFWGTYSFEQRMNLFYLDIPVMAKLTFQIGEARIYGGVGPYLGIGLAGTWYTEVSYFGATDISREVVRWGNDETNDDLKRLDFGLTSAAGFEIFGLFFEAGYNLGLANISAYTEDGSRISNRVLTFSIGYRFRQSE